MRMMERAGTQKEEEEEDEEEEEEKKREKRRRGEEIEIRPAGFSAGARLGWADKQYASYVPVLFLQIVTASIPVSVCSTYAVEYGVSVSNSAILVPGILVYCCFCVQTQRT